MNYELTEYKGYKIFHFGDGFSSLMLYGKSGLYFTTYFTVTKNDQISSSFSFGVSSLSLALNNVRLDSKFLVSEALDVVKDTLDKTDDPKSIINYDFMYDLTLPKPNFRQIEHPAWKAEPGI